jgi:hypothetical protein
MTCNGITHPDFPGWVLGSFSDFDSYPRATVTIRLHGVIVGWRHDEDKYSGIPERVTALSDTPGAQERVETFYRAVMALDRAKKAEARAKWQAETNANMEEEQAAADRVMFGSEGAEE